MSQLQLAMQLEKSEEGPWSCIGAAGGGPCLACALLVASVDGLLEHRGTGAARCARCARACLAASLAGLAGCRRGRLLAAKELAQGALLHAARPGCGQRRRARMTMMAHGCCQYARSLRKTGVREPGRSVRLCEQAGSLPGAAGACHLRLLEGRAALCRAQQCCGAGVCVCYDAFIVQAAPPRQHAAAMAQAGAQQQTCRAC